MKNPENLKMTKNDENGPKKGHFWKKHEQRFNVPMVVKLSKNGQKTGFWPFWVFPPD